jgi:hypothetical protein
MDTTTAPKTPSFEAVVKPAKEVFYVTVGLGVKAYEQLKSNRGELCGWFENQVADGKAQFETQATQIEERVGAARERAGQAARAGLRAHEASRDAAKTAREQLKDFVNRGTQSAAA